MKIPRADVITLTALLTDFEEMCKSKGVRFDRYTPDQLWDFLMLYRSYKQHPPSTAPF